MFRNKEIQNLLNVRTNALSRAEERIENLTKLNKWLKDENKALRYENEELELFKHNILNTINEKGTIVDKYDRIKNLVEKLTIAN